MSAYIDGELTLLSKEDISGKNSLDVLKKFGNKMAVTDLAILTGAIYDGTEENHARYDATLRGRTGNYYTKSNDADNQVQVVSFDGNSSWIFYDNRRYTIRPVLKCNSFNHILANSFLYRDVPIVLYGEYPQYAAEDYMQRVLENEYQNNTLSKTGHNYTFDSTMSLSRIDQFSPVTYEEYQYQSKKYIRVIANYNSCYCYGLSNGLRSHKDASVWVEVSPIVWLVDEKTKTLVSQRGLVSGIRFSKEEYKGDFSKTEIKMYLDQYMKKDLFQGVTMIEEVEERVKPIKRVNPYGFNFGRVSEEDIIKGAIESNIPVFLHGASSEGKSARIKQIDPTCEVIYLRNATPEYLNGKSAYNSRTGKMIDVPPVWLKNVEEKCKKEPNKLHIVFFDELTNALPSIQGMTFNIILDREVNGIWKLPDNTRIVAAGNDMSESIAANMLAEPLFNRFAHVYIKTTLEKWLKWASENNIHPAIYSYIAYTKGEALRSRYDGKKPNADPRKWEMASKVLYQTNNPEMLRALVGEDITREFIAFCKQRVITLEDVINDNYGIEDIENLNTAERYATVICLSQVDEENLIKVRNFVKEMGDEYVSVFDVLWTHNDEERLEILQEIKLGEGQKTKVKRG